MESEEIRISILPNLGFKIGSIYHKAKEREVLIQPDLNQYVLPDKECLEKDEAYRYYNSGLNDMIPTSKPCIYPGDGKYGAIKLPDGGDLWDKSWETEIVKDELIGKIDLSSLPLSMKKTMKLVDETTLEMNYEVVNNTECDIYYLWNLEGFYQSYDNVDFIFQEDMNFKINVLTHEDLNSFDTSKIGEYRNDRSYRYFFYGDLKKGLVGLDYKEDRLKYLIEYDTKKLPYLGVYVDKREMTASIYPSNSFFDSVEVAYDNHTIHEIKANSLDSWTVRIKLEDY